NHRYLSVRDIAGQVEPPCARAHPSYPNQTRERSASRQKPSHRSRSGAFATDGRVGARIIAAMARRRRTWSVSVLRRGLAALIGLSALAMTAAGLPAYSVERDHTADLVDAALTRNAAEVETLFEEGVDPETGQPFASVEAVIRMALSRVVPAENQALAGFMGTQLSHVPRTATSFRFQDDPQLVAALAPVSSWSAGDRMTVQTDRGTYRVYAQPVRSEDGSEAGAVVFAFDMDAEFAEIGDTFRTYALVAALALAWITVIGWFVMGRMLIPVTVLRSAAAEISSS